MWKIYSHPVNPTIVLDNATTPPEGYVYEADTANPNYLAENYHVNTDFRITVLAFRNRFTKAEKVTMDLASIDNPGASAESRQLSAAIRVDMKDSDNATFIDLARAETISGVNTLEAYGIIGVGRANTILTTPITAIERLTPNV